MIPLANLSFFEKFPRDLVEKLQSCAQKIQCNKGEKIIEQGKVNQDLYFLMTGTLHVYVDQGLVASLSQQGDLVGEMSLISEQKSTATIVAETSVELIKIDGVALHQLAEQGHSGIETLYKVYADILLQKLEVTNHRAKKLEGVVEELEQAYEKMEAVNASLDLKVKDRTAKLEKNLEEIVQKNTELKAMYGKVADLYQSRDITFSSLEKLLSEHLVPLEEKIKQIRQGAEPKVDVQKFESEIRRSIRMLEPLTKSFSAEKSMSSKKVLLAESVRKQQTVAKMALGGTGVDLMIVQTEDEAKQALQNSSYDIFMFSEDFLSLTDYAKEKQPELEFVFVTSKDIPEYVNVLLEHSFVPNIVNRDEEDKQFTIKNFVTTVSKLASGNYFGLEKYIAWGVDVKEIDILGSQHRPQVIEQMDKYFANSGVRSSNRGRVSVVAEELLMNAIYDAPRDQKGEPLYNHLDRTQAIQLEEEHRPLLRFATDGVLMAVSIEDPFGALQPETLFRYLEKCYTSQGSLNDGRADKGGGGRGLHQIIENSELVVFNLDPGKRTEVIALFNVDQKAAGDRNPNLHFFKVAS